MTLFNNNPEISDIAAEPGSLLYFKQLLRQKAAHLKMQFDPFHSVSDLLKERSDFIDGILSSCWQHFLADYASRLSLVAVGGYGRRELFPYSDIDIVVLLDSVDTTPYQEALGNFLPFFGYDGA